MFQTEIHIAVQTLSSDFFTWLMLQVTATGYYQFVLAMVVAVMFGISLRKGFLLFQIIAWTAVFSEIAKDVFGLPRPFFTDNRVALLDPHWDAVTPLHAMGGEGFFDLPRQQAINAFRLKDLSFGFPSGHTSGAVAMWGGLAVVFRKRTLAWFAPVMVALIAFTRIYLGVHFLADVLGGAMLGGLVLFAAWKLIGSDENRDRFFAAARARLAVSLPGILYGFFLFIFPVLLVLFSLLSAKFAGFYFGLNAAFTMSIRSGLPEDRGTLLAKLARVLLGGLLFFSFNLALNRALFLVPVFSSTRWGQFLSAGLGTFLTLWGGLKLFVLLGLYQKEKADPAR